MNTQAEENMKAYFQGLANYKASALLAGIGDREPLQVEQLEKAYRDAMLASGGGIVYRQEHNLKYAVASAIYDQLRNDDTGNLVSLRKTFEKLIAQLTERLNIFVHPFYAHVGDPRTVEQLDEAREKGQNIYIRHVYQVFTDAKVQAPTLYAVFSFDVHVTSYGGLFQEPHIKRLTMDLGDLLEHALGAHLLIRGKKEDIERANAALNAWREESLANYGSEWAKRPRGPEFIEAVKARD